MSQKYPYATERNESTNGGANNELEIQDEKNKKTNIVLNWMRIFCLSNFHFHTRFPLLKWIKTYKLRDFLSDSVAGIIITFIIVVQAIAIALIVNVPSEHGIYSSLFGGFVNFLFGTSKDVSIGPTLLGGVICSRYNEHGSPIVVAIISFFSGIVFLIMSFINMGFVMEFISYPVLTGWITSGAITIFISQLPSWFGLKIENFTMLSSYELFIAVINNISKTKLGDMAVGCACFAISCALYFAAPVINKFTKSSKSTCSKITLSTLSYVVLARVGWIILFSSIVANILATNFGWSEHFTFLPSTPSKLPPFTNPFTSIEVNGTNISTVQIIKDAYPSFILVPIVIMIETLAGARNFAKQFSYQVDNNQELMCLGLVNVLNSFFEGFPVGGALARTSVNALSGCKSLFSGLITSVLLIPTMLYLMSYISYISKAAIGASICAAALTQVQLLSLKNLWQISKLQLLPWMFTFICGLYKLELGMLAGFVVSAAFIMWRELRPRIHLVYDHANEVATLYVKGAIHFPGAYSLSNRLRTIKNFHPLIKKIIIDCSNMYETDSSVVEELKEAILTVENQNISVTLKHLKKGKVQNLILGAGLNKYFIKGLRTNSCTADFHVAPHFIQYHSNPRDLWPQTEAWEEPISESASVNDENDTNYLYTVKTISSREHLAH